MFGKTFGHHFPKRLFIVYEEQMLRSADGHREVTAF
jgi:hypothetical protein